ncbi:MAG: D-cysteine desulfhydrase family protein [Armatimonadota bacterium]|nr:D-cysteine desulfhydrase family protein [Armatimonadota bacterium]
MMKATPETMAVAVESRLHREEVELPSGQTMSYPPRIPLGLLPTRIAECPSLSARLGGRRLAIKHDDETGCVTTGNKVRKLEFYIAEAMQSGADTLVTAGSTLSNHCRTTAFVARELGYDVHLVLSGPESPLVNGNYLLMLLAGAEIRLIPIERHDDKDDFVREAASELEAAGAIPYVIPPGGTGALGVIAYVRAVQELRDQLAETGTTVDAITVTFGSGSTYSGLLLGTRLLGLDLRVLGMSIGTEAGQCREIVRDLIAQACSVLGVDVPVSVDDILITDAYCGPGYGQNTESDFEFIKEMARETGLVLDPTYTGKAFRGTLEEMQTGQLADCQDVLFLHTGGIFGLFPKRKRFGPSA